MAQSTDATNGESERDHPTADLETIVVEVDDVIETMRRNKRDEREQRSHVLRVSPSFEGERKATPHVSETHTYYPPEMDPKPIHLSPAALLLGHDAGAHHPDYRDEWTYPDMTEERALFRNERDINEDDRPLSDELEDEWDEWWTTVVEMWEDRVRHALKHTDELMLTSQHPEIGNTTVAVRVEESED